MSKFNLDTDFCRQCGCDSGWCDGCVKKKYYQQGRADCLREAHRFADQETYKEGYKRGLEQGKADVIEELVDAICCHSAFTNMQKDAIRTFAEQLKEQNK